MRSSPGTAVSTLHSLPGWMPCLLSSVRWMMIKDFDRYAKRYHIDYSIQKDLSCKPPRYLIYFKAQDTDALNAAFKEYSASVLDKTKRPSVLAKLHDLAQSVANLPDKVRHKQEERGL